MSAPSTEGGGWKSGEDERNDRGPQPADTITEADLFDAAFALARARGVDHPAGYAAAMVANPANRPNLEAEARRRRGRDQNAAPTILEARVAECPRCDAAGWIDLLPDGRLATEATILQATTRARCRHPSLAL